MCFFKQKEPPSPRGIVDKDNISELNGIVTIEGLPDRINLTTVSNTDSMLPIIDYGDIAILTLDFDHKQLAIGDIVVYQGNTSIIHRIVKINETDEGRIYTCRGDNCSGNDPYYIGDEHIYQLLIGIIYCKKKENV